MTREELDTIIRKEAAKLYERVLDRYMKLPRDKWTAKSLRDMIEEELSSYNRKLSPLIEGAVYGLLAESLRGENLPSILPTSLELSNLLYKNSKEVASNTYRVLREDIKAQKAIRDLAMALYEGYGFKDKEVLDPFKRLPKYMRRELKKASVSQQVIQQVEALKTKGLKAGYNGILKALQDHTGRSLENAVKVALEERSRYYALRIAATETARSSRLSEAYGYLTDEGIELVRYQMNPTHPFPDICDALAKADFGFGPGIYPKDKMVALPAHPFCGCRYYPIYSGRKKKPGKFSGWETALRNMKPYEQVRALGSREAWLEWKSGTPAEEIWNSKRPRYPVAPVKDYLPVE